MRKRAAVSLLLSILMLAGLTPMVSAQETPGGGGDTSEGRLILVPDGWTIVNARSGPELRWRLDEPLPIRAARPEFRVGDLVVGYPLERSGALVLSLDDELADLLATDGLDLQVWLGAQRLDGPGESRDIPGAVDDGPLPRQPATVLPAADDPGRPGPYNTVRLDYELDGLDVGFPAPLEVLAEVVAPRNAPGERPVVLFLHGRHATCYTPDTEFADGSWPCPDGTLPIPSHRGYRYVAELLASQGYITVSISANGVNGQDFRAPDGGANARSKLIHHHLDLWADWADGGDPWGGRFEGRIDPDRVVLVGHSRGGEGVERAAVDAPAGGDWTIVGLADIAPTAFGHQRSAGIPTMVILPYCDGDVVDLQGQLYVDRSRDLTEGRDVSLRSSVMVLGANHNFFNTEWTPGLAEAPSNDDWFGRAKACDPAGDQRLTPEAQQAVGATMIAALVHTAVERDTAAASLIDGSPVRARSAGDAVVLTHALGANRTVLYRAGQSATVSGTDVDSRICEGALAGDMGSISECDPTVGSERIPHWLAFGGAEERTIDAWDVRWRRAGGAARVQLGGPVDLSDSDALELRIATDPSEGPARFQVAIVDRSGNARPVGDPIRLVPLPGARAPLGKIWAQTVRVSLDGVDASGIAGIEIRPLSNRGRVWVLDAHGWAPGLPRTSRIALPRVSIGTVTVREGDEGTRTVRVPLEVRGRADAPAVVWAVVSQGRRTDLRRVEIRPGQRPTIAVQVRGDEEWNSRQQVTQVRLLAGTNAMTGRYIGRVVVRDDDPAPELTFTATETVTEGDTITVTATFSEAPGRRLFYGLRLRNPAGGLPVLDTDDLTEEYVQTQFGMVPDPPLPLPNNIFGFIEIRARATTATFEMPTVDDGVVEGTGSEGIGIVVRPNRGDPLLEDPIRFEVVVQDAV